MAQSENDHGLHAIAITDRVEQVSRRIARIWAVAAVTVFVVLAATVGFPHGPDLETWERQAQLFALAVLAVGTLVAWKWEGIGGSILVIAAASLGVLAAFPGGGQFGFIEVRDDGTTTIAVRITGRDWTGATIVAYSFTVPVPEVTS